ncbi:hypothetical protein FQA47_024728 [Oryzias melastigma]|uniref:Uncharacterized protein n=1 Tax=Oryzias melastigma TaxID=30732 RepID=A0A834C1F3_ORYME|nr:hypothetical protein FQA47_024728 [Oryzias melastigma]
MGRGAARLEILPSSSNALCRLGVTDAQKLQGTIRLVSILNPVDGRRFCFPAPARPPPECKRVRADTRGAKACPVRKGRAFACSTLKGNLCHPFLKAPVSPDGWNELRDLESWGRAWTPGPSPWTKTN